MLEQESSFRKTRKKLMLIEKIALFLSKTQGRDKLCKLLQYLFKFLAAFFQLDSYLNIKYTSLSEYLESIKDARKIFRLFKSVNQYEGMTYILFNQEQNFTNLLKVLSRVCFFFYWAFDNVSILSKIKLFRLNSQKLYKIGYSFWFFALVFVNSALFYQVFFTRIETMKRISDFQSQIPVDCPLIAQFETDKKSSFIQLTEKQKREIRKDKLLYLMRYTFDMIPAGKDSQILEIIFNRVIPQKLTGFCGFMSAAISIYQVILQVSKK